MHSPEQSLQEGEALVASHAHGTPGFARGLALLQEAAAAGSVEAELTLGHVYAQVHLLPDADTEAATWYRRAAERGHPAAQDRLADLYMAGRGVPQSDVEAFTWYRRTAEQAYPVAQCNLAYMLAEGIGTGADDEAATSWYLRAAAQGDARACFNLGLRFRAGHGAAANAVHAAALMANAARQGYPYAGEELAALQAQLTPAERADADNLAVRLAANFDSLQRRLEREPQLAASAERYRLTVEEHFTTLGVPAFSFDAMHRPAGGRATAPSRHCAGARQELAERPRVFTVDEFVSRGEAAHLMALASVDFHSAETGRDRLSQEHTAFTGSAATLHTGLSDPVVRVLERRIAAAFGLTPAHVEPVSVLRYQGGDLYAPHVDYFDTPRLEYNRSIGDRGGQRSASFLVYLKAPEAGGETDYIELGRKVAGRDRMALCHFNLLPSGEPDPKTLHTGTAVRRGEKWLARTTLRENPLF